MRMCVLAGKRNILIVDDETAVAESLGLIFSTQGYEVREALDAKQAIEILAGWKPDAAILDVMLPGMNGIELSAVLKSNYPECAVLLVSGHPGAADLMSASEGEDTVYDILAKPLHPALLLETVAALLPPAACPARMAKGLEARDTQA